MSNFFFRSSDIKASDIETNARHRNNAYVKILSSGGSQLLPVDLESSRSKRDSTRNTINYTYNKLGSSGKKGKFTVLPLAKCPITISKSTI